MMKHWRKHGKGLVKEVFGCAEKQMTHYDSSVFTQKNTQFKTYFPCGNGTAWLYQKAHNKTNSQADSGNSLA